MVILHRALDQLADHYLPFLVSLLGAALWVRLEDLALQDAQAGRRRSAGTVPVVVVSVVGLVAALEVATRVLRVLTAREVELAGLIELCGLIELLGPVVLPPLRPRSVHRAPLGVGARRTVRRLVPRLGRQSTFPVGSRMVRGLRRSRVLAVGSVPHGIPPLASLVRGQRQLVTACPFGCLAGSEVADASSRRDDTGNCHDEGELLPAVRP
mmetsp:Transcript_56856/g.128246  ORF Transcript_56856/g.128246 Transcript_56856/m.128246 type:complete len:211 (-) Transcript_56856:125-757(-)